MFSKFNSKRINTPKRNHNGSITSFWLLYSFSSYVRSIRWTVVRAVAADDVNNYWKIICFNRPSHWLTKFQLAVNLNSFVRNFNGSFLWQIKFNDRWRRFLMTYQDSAFVWKSIKENKKKPKWIINSSICFYF